MTKTRLIIVTGAPATGKTTVGQRIANAFDLPMISKDGIKESLFDSLGWKDRAWSKRLGIASMDLLFYFATVQLQAGRSSIVEGNFDPRFHLARFHALRQKNPFEPFQIVCRTHPETLAQRYRHRALSAERHMGHLDSMLLEEFDPEELGRRHTALAIGGPVVQVDTTDFNNIDYQDLFRTIGAVVEDA